MAGMVTLRSDGTPHVAQVGVGLVDTGDGNERLLASGTSRRVRTRHLRRDPRATLFVFGPPMGWLGLETTVQIIEGPEVPEWSLRLYRAVLGIGPNDKIAWGGQEMTDGQLIGALIAEQRLIYEFEIHRAYGEPNR